MEIVYMIEGSFQKCGAGVDSSVSGDKTAGYPLGEKAS